MARKPEFAPQLTGLESKNRQELEALWEKADNTPGGIADGFSQGQIAQALDKLNHREALISDTVEPVPASDLPYKDRLGRVQNVNILRMRKEAAAAIRAKYPETFKKEERT